MSVNESGICAVIVTYNRVKLLKECIESIKSQTFKCDILVIDNNSSDGTREFLLSEQIAHISLNENLGGAGGFNTGIREAIKREYESVWVMDDDCVAFPDSLERLMEAASILKMNFGFLASRVVWVDGSDHMMNKIEPSKAAYMNHIFQIKQATFTSLLINRSAILSAGLPIKDFFIWGDDIEYTRRIAVRKHIPSYYVDNSVIVHKTKNNIGSKIAFDDSSNLNRYYYAYRNENYLYRQEGIKGIVYYVCKCAYNIIRIILFSKDKKILRIRTMLSAIIDGISFNPEVEYPV